MKIHKPKFRFIHSAIKLSVLLIITVLTGCIHSNTHTTSKTEDHTTIYNEPRSKIIQTKQTPVVRYGRYTLVEVGTTSSQQELLNQIIDITIPVSSYKQTTTVSDAMHYVLLNSGYQLCDAEPVSAFSYFKLPLAHRHLGPITLKEALTTLAGNSWQMQVDQQNRLICFTNQAELIVQEVTP